MYLSILTVEKGSRPALPVFYMNNILFRLVLHFRLSYHIKIGSIATYINHNMKIKLPIVIKSLHSCPPWQTLSLNSWNLVNVRWMKLPATLVKVVMCLLLGLNLLAPNSLPLTSIAQCVWVLLIALPAHGGIRNTLLRKLDCITSTNIYQNLTTMLINLGFL